MDTALLSICCVPGTDPGASPHQQGRGEGCRHPDFPSEQKSGASSEATEGALNPSA